MAITPRDVTDADLPIFFDLQRDLTYNHMAAFTHKDPDDRAAFDAHWKKILANPENKNRTIVFEGQVAGHIASFPMGGDREITYGIARQFWGRGLATEALRAFLALDTERPLRARAAKDNIGSLRVLAKCGFEVTGEEIGFANARGQEIEEVVLRLS
jgi:RimJ/RimL family protein N-acetyltransferase